MQPIIFTLTLSDNLNNKKYIALTKDDMFLNSSQVYMTSKNKCIIPIKGTHKVLLNHTNPTWLVGKALLSKYYTIFNASSLSSGNSPNLQIGIGPKNPIDLIGLQDI